MIRLLESGLWDDTLRAVCNFLTPIRYEMSITDGNEMTPLLYDDLGSMTERYDTYAGLQSDLKPFVVYRIFSNEYRIPLKFDTSSATGRF